MKRTITVPTMTCAFARSPSILTSGSVGHCIVVGALYASRGIYEGGMIHHFEFERLRPETLDMFLQMIQPKHDLGIYLAGGRPTYNEGKYDFVDAARVRAYVLNRVQHHSLSDKIRAIRWNDNLSQGIILTLNLRIGRADFSSYVLGEC